MVLPLRPGKFYGSSLPRPRIYTDVKFSDERVDPPLPVHDSLLSWASEAHWSMGGLSRKRLRLQGKIEGNIQKLKKEQESFLKKHPQISTPDLKQNSRSKLKGKLKRVDSPSPPPVSRKLKLRSRMIAMVGEGEEEEEEEDEEETVAEVKTKRRRLVRKLGDDFEMVADDNVKTVSSRTRKRTMVLMEEDEEDDESDNAEAIDSPIKSVSVKKGFVSPNALRSSPRLKQKSG